MVSIVDAAKVRKEVMDKFGVKLHIHDTCGSFYMNIDDPDDAIREYVVNRFKEMNQELEIDDSGCYFSVD